MRRGTNTQIRRRKGGRHADASSSSSDDGSCSDDVGEKGPQITPGRHKHQVLSPVIGYASAHFVYDLAMWSNLGGTPSECFWFLLTSCKAVALSSTSKALTKTPPTIQLEDHSGHPRLAWHISKLHTTPQDQTVVVPFSLDTYTNWAFRVMP